MLNRSTVVLALSALLGCGGAGTATYDVDAVSYGIIPDFPVSGLIAGADTARRMDIQMMVWVLRDDERTVLVDAGFYRDKYFERWTVEDFVRPSEALAALGIAPDDVTDIIVTHLHWDHAGGMDLFPNAQVWIQRAELAYYRDEVENPAAVGVDPEDLAVLAELQERGALHLVDGDSVEVFPGVTVYTGGRHTYASQFVGVDVADGTIVIASDNVYLYENLDLRVPIAQTFDAESNLAAQDRMRRLASRLEYIVPGHDPAVFERFPGPVAGVASIR